jgi:hypothetical protein
LLRKLALHPQVDTITPAVISRVRGRSQGLRLRISAPLTGGWKLVARRGSSAQEVFLTTSLDREALQRAVDDLIKAR